MATLYAKIDVQDVVRWTSRSYSGSTTELLDNRFGERQNATVYVNDGWFTDHAADAVSNCRKLPSFWRTQKSNG